jgi:nicotinamidase-related amidase
MKPIENAVHLCVDMQRIFAKGGAWETPWMERVLPTIVDIASCYAARTVFSRFITPTSPEQAAGQWRPYFERWRRATREMLEVSQLDLIPPLARLVPPATIIDKSTYSAFFRSELAGWLRDRHVTTIVVTGARRPTSACCRRCWMR